MADDIPQVTADELARGLETGAPLQILDVRAPQRLAQGTIDLGDPARFHNVPGSRLFAMRDPREGGLDPALPVAVVCGHGNSSKTVASWLNARGFTARSVRGGMAAWMRMLVPRVLAPPDGFDQLVQFDRVGRGALSYLLVASRQALLIDPPRHADDLLAWLAKAGAELVAVADTHVHADYVSGGPALAARFGVPYYLHAADAIYPYDGRQGSVAFTPIADGATVALGSAALEVVHTPGHTEGSCTYLADSAAFTGDFVFVRSIGRPDLAGTAAAWTKDLWASLERARAAWAPTLEVYPAHYAGERERTADRSVHGTWGTLLRENEPLLLPTLDAFREWVVARVGDAPDAYRIIKAINVGLQDASDEEIEVLEVGKNECAIA